MSETKAVRLSRAARNLNVGIQTIVEFLGEQGIEIEARPTTKLDPEVYGILLKEFQSDKEAKAQASSISNRQRSMRETITLESSEVEESDATAPDNTESVDTVALEAAKAKTEVATPPVPKEEKVVEVPKAEEVEKEEKKEEPTPEVVEAPIVEETSKEEPAEVEAIETPAKEEVKEETVVETKEADKKSEKPGVKVVAKVDLEKVDPKTKKAAEVKKAEEAKKVSDEAIVKEKEEKAAREKQAAADAKAAKKPEGVIRARAEKLSGPTVVGKIVLPVEKKAKPVASSSDTDRNLRKKKRPRKRIAKVDVKKQSHDNRKKGGARGKGGVKKPEISEKDIQKEIKETLARLSGKGKSKASKLRRQKRDAVAQRTEEEMQRAEDAKSVLQLTEFVTVSELSSMMDVSVNKIISACMSLGIFASINQRLDAETIQIITEEFGYSVEFVSADVQEIIEVEEDTPESLVTRPPIVTVMGHVDHGKTSFLDYVRSASVVSGEAGGITQHIGAYTVEVSEGKQITFLDTPGHEAFTAMRARGAQVTDLAIIVIAADDAVMPQTKEAISHAQAAGIPMIFAINKVDRPNANPDKIKEELSQLNILVEDWGGKYQNQNISAKTGEGIADLLEKVLLEAELLELKANPNKRAVGTVVESSLDKGRGYVTTLLVEAGTLRVGDPILAGQWSGRVKAMHNERAQKEEAAGPSIPVSILGMDGAPNAGDNFYVLEDEKESRAIALRRQQLQREQGIRAHKHITMEEIGRRIALGEFKELNLIVKGDVDGSVEALTDSLQKQSTEKVQVNVIHKAVGQISESDVLLATASDAIIIGFQVRPSASARKLAEKEEIQIRQYSVIYAAIDDMKEAMEGLLSARIEEKVVGSAEVRDVFKISKVGTIAGSFMMEGTINRNNKVRVIRDGVVIYTGVLASLKRFKDDVKEVKKGFECGIDIEKFNDIQPGDIIEAFELVEVKQTLHE